MSDRFDHTLEHTLESKPNDGGEGAERFALFVAAAVLANNLMIVGELLTKRSRRRRKSNRPLLS